ncbi:hypothetical protein L7F22_004717 [Adiantum nelumboides]|nr:hypothetical protein [Adiantum nelumboides]
MDDGNLHDLESFTRQVYIVSQASSKLILCLCGWLCLIALNGSTLTRSYVAVCNHPVSTRLSVIGSSSSWKSADFHVITSAA